MKLIKFNKEIHYKEVSKWWSEHNKLIVPKDSLSSVGLVVYNGGKPVCMSFLYIMAGCNMAQIAWTTTNPKAGLKERYKAINFCIEGLLEIAKKNNRKNVVCFSSNKSLSKIIASKGLIEQHSHDLLLGNFGGI